MFGRRKDGFQTEEEFIIATIVVTISEHKESFGFARFFFDHNRQRDCRYSVNPRLATAPLFCNDVALRLTVWYNLYRERRQQS